MALAALTVDPLDKITALKFPRLAASSCDYGVIPPCIERLFVVILPFDLLNLMEVQGFVCVADFEILADHPCDLLSRDHALFFLCSFFLNADLSFEVTIS